jgi:hypothetical protein
MSVPAETLPPPHDAESARIRNAVVDRLLRMNARHATHAWLHRRAHPVGPHGVAFLYCAAHAGPDPREPPRHSVAAATRLVDAAEDVRDVSRLLYRLTTLAQERYLRADSEFDPRRHMTNRSDPMPAHATYIGIGVSSLDTAETTWEQTQQRAAGPLDIPGRCFGLLRDGTMLLLDRGGQDVYGEVRVCCTHDLNVEPGLPTRRWSWHPDLRTVPGTDEIWRRLADLHAVTSQGGVRPNQRRTDA